MTEWWGERGCDCVRDLQGLLWLMVMLVQLELELEGVGGGRRNLRVQAEGLI